MKNTKCFLAAIAATLLAGSTAARAAAPPGAAGGDRVIAQVGSATITVADFEKEMAKGAAMGLYDKPEQRRALLEEMVNFRLLLAKAQQAGLDKDPDVVRVYQRMMVSKYQDRQFKAAVESVKVTDQEVNAFYQAHLAEYARPARFQGAIVYVGVSKTATDEARTKARQRAEEALTAAKALPPSETAFGTVAKDYSEDQASRYRGGVIGWLIQHEGEHYRWDQKVIDAIFALQSGQIGPIVETPGGYYLVRLASKEPAAPQPLERLSEGIRQRLLKQKRDAIEREIYQRLSSEVGVKVDAQAVDALQPPPRVPAAPPPLPGGH